MHEREEEETDVLENHRGTVGREARSDPAREVVAHT